VPGGEPDARRCVPRLVFPVFASNTHAVERSRITPKPGQESAWDFPQTPRVEASRRPAAGELRGVVLFNVHGGYRVIERGFAPTFYVAQDQTRMELLVDSGRRLACPHRGVIGYWSFVSQGERLGEIAWTCVQPSPAFECLRGHIAFFPGALDAVWLDGERVEAIPSAPFGGWRTSHTVGPFLGERSAQELPGGHHAALPNG